MSANRISRRAFTSRAAAFTFSAVTASNSLGQSSKDETVVIHPEIAVGRVRPELHGHFAEHLGSCIYGGLWVGKKSPVPNINGYRKQAVDYLKALGIPVLRWPGGCFADDYHWRDGIGPAARRPKTRQHPLGQLHRGQQLRHARVHRAVPADRQPSRTSPATSAAARPRSCATGWSTATTRRAARSPTSAPPTARRNRSTSATGAWATRTGAAAGNMTAEEYAAQLPPLRTLPAQTSARRRPS